MDRRSKDGYEYDGFVAGESDQENESDYEPNSDEEILEKKRLREESESSEEDYSDQEEKKSRPESELQASSDWLNFVLDEAMEESDSDVKPRKRERLASSGIEAAFRLLKDGDYQGFLDEPIIKQKRLCHVIELVNQFGQGYGEYNNELCHLHWQGRLIVKESKHVPGSTCGHCNMNRDLRFYFFEDVRDLTSDELANYDPDDIENDRRFICVGGPHCYGIKFKALMSAIDTCTALANRVDEPGFLSMAIDHLTEVNKKALYSHTDMQSKYAHKKGKTVKNNG